MRPTPIPPAHAAATTRLGAGRVAMVHDGSRIALAAAGPDGGVTGIVLFVETARAWAARVAPLRHGPPPGDDLVPITVRTPWARGDDGELAVALEREGRRQDVAWRLMVRGPRGELAVALSAADVAELLHRLQAPPEASREAG